MCGGQQSAGTGPISLPLFVHLITKATRVFMSYQDHTKTIDASHSKAEYGGSYKKSVKPAAVCLYGSLWIFILKELFDNFGIALICMIKIDSTLLTVLNMKLQSGDSLLSIT